MVLRVEDCIEMVGGLVGRFFWVICTIHIILPRLKSVLSHLKSILLSLKSVLLHLKSDLLSLKSVLSHLKSDLLSLKSVLLHLKRVLLCLKSVLSRYISYFGLVKTNICYIPNGFKVNEIKF